MSSFQITISPSRRAAARFVKEVRRELQRALVNAKAEGGISQSDVSRAIDVHRSTISREINGRRDISLGRLGEIGAAIGMAPRFTFEKPEPKQERRNFEAFSIEEADAVVSSVEVEVMG